MTKIENYKDKAAIAKRLATHADQALGRDSPSNDKHSFTATFRKMEGGDWNPMLLAIHMSHGYFGNSSGYSDTSSEMGVFLAMAINKHKTLLLDTAVAMAKDEAEQARKAAEDEARAVLQETAA